MWKERGERVLCKDRQQMERKYGEFGVVELEEGFKSLSVIDRERKARGKGGRGVSGRAAVLRCLSRRTQPGDIF